MIINMAPTMTPPLNGETQHINGKDHNLNGVDPKNDEDNNTYIQNFSSEPISLQEKIEKWAVKYVKRYPEIIEFMKDNDASLKNKDLKYVEAMVPISASVIALAAHEKAHELFKTSETMKMIQAGKIAAAAKKLTAIDIHPATKIGHCCFLDHGFGFVAGETGEIGDHTVVLHGVTLGNFTSTNEARPERLAHRHPRIGHHCVIYTGAKILGNIQIGNNVKICPSAELSGNKIEVKDGATIGNSAKIFSGNTIESGVVIGEAATIGSTVEINSGNTIAKGVKIGEGAVITANTGLINQDIPAHMQVSRDEDTKKLNIISLTKHDKKIAWVQGSTDALVSSLNISDENCFNRRYISRKIFPDDRDLEGPKDLGMFSPSM